MTDNKSTVILSSDDRDALFGCVTTGYYTGYIQVIHKVDQKTSRFF